MAQLRDVSKVYGSGETEVRALNGLDLDVMRGDSTLFTRSDEVEAAWQIMDPILNGWGNDPKIPMQWPPLVRITRRQGERENHSQFSFG